MQARGTGTLTSLVKELLKKPARGGVGCCGVVLWDVVPVGQASASQADGLYGCYFKAWLLPLRSSSLLVLLGEQQRMVQGLVPLCSCAPVLLWEIWRKLLIPRLVLAQPLLALVVVPGEVSQQMQERLLPVKLHNHLESAQSRSERPGREIVGSPPLLGYDFHGLAQKLGQGLGWLDREALIDTREGLVVELLRWI